MRSVIPLLLISCCAPAAFAREEFKRDFAKTVALTAGRPLRIEHQFGRVSVRTHTRNEVVVTATIRASAPTAERARQAANDVQIVVEEGVIRTTYPRSFPRDTGYTADLDVTMPQTSPLDLRNRFGATDVSSLHAPATIVSGNGSVTLLTCRGRHRIENSFGNVEVRNNEGDVTIQNGNGHVTAIDINGVADVGNRFGNIRAANVSRGLTVRSSNGTIEADAAGGPIQITNTFGRVTVTEAKGDATVLNQNGDVVANGVAGAADLHTTFGNVTASRVGKSLTVRAQNSNVRGDMVSGAAVVETTFGSVDLRNVQGGARAIAGNSAIKLMTVGGEVYAKSTFAGITITDAAGPITVENQNGSVTAEAKAGAGCKPVSLRTTFGPIRVTIPRGGGYNLTARTTFGHIRTEPSVQVAMSGELSQQNITGKIGGGGCELQLVGQNSSIDIVSR